MNTINSIVSYIVYETMHFINSMYLCVIIINMYWCVWLQKTHWCIYYDTHCLVSSKEYNELIYKYFNSIFFYKFSINYFKIKFVFIIILFYIIKQLCKEEILITLLNYTNFVQTFHDPPSLRPCCSSLSAVGHPRAGTKLHWEGDS